MTTTIHKKTGWHLDKTIRAGSPAAANDILSLCEETQTLAYRSSGTKTCKSWPMRSTMPMAAISAVQTWFAFSHDQTATALPTVAFPWRFTESFERVSAKVGIVVDGPAAAYAVQLRAFTLIDTATTSAGSGSPCSISDKAQMEVEFGKGMANTHIKSYKTYVAEPELVVNTADTFPANRRILIEPRVTIMNTHIMDPLSISYVNAYLKYIVLYDRVTEEIT